MDFGSAFDCIAEAIAPIEDENLKLLRFIPLIIQTDQARVECYEPGRMRQKRLAT
jgi:hypothetical protein